MFGISLRFCLTYIVTPSLHSYRYMELNVRASPGYSRPDPLTPSYLIHAPDWLKKPIVQHLNSSLTTDDVNSLGGSHYKVKSESKGDAWHTLSLGSEDSHPRYTCHEWQQHKLPCKHVCSLQVDRWSFLGQSTCHIQG